MWSFFSRDPTVQFSYEVGAEVSEGSASCVWRLHEGKNKSNGEVVSIFVLDKSANDYQIQLAKKALKRFKTLRHPNVVTYINELETEKVIYLVTESVMPLAQVLANDDNSSNEFSLSWGIHQVVRSVGFFNDANLVHSNICLSSIYVDKGGEWKIGGLEFMFTSSEEPSKLVPSFLMYEPPEVGKGGSVAQKLVSARDSWGLGCLIWEVYNGPLSKQTQLKTVGKISKSLVPNYCELVSANPKTRPVASKFLNDCKATGAFMDNDFVNTMLFIEEIEIKDQMEKNKFFERLTPIIDKIPESTCKWKILPKLLKAYDFGGAGSAILSPILKLGKYLTEAEYQQKIVPCVVKLFYSPDRATRVKLLQQIEIFADHLLPKTVNEKIFPSVIQGFMDTNPLVRENTIKAMIHLAPKLGYKPLNEELMRHFARLQSKDPEPGIRTNTTICLGKIACYINPQIRQKILISAFTRGLRDSSRPARLASIQAMAATQRFYTVQDIGQRLLPVLVTLTVDPDPSIREAVFKVVKGLLANLERVSEKPELIEEVEQCVLSSDSGSYDDSWSGWAKNLTSKLYKNKDQSALKTESNQDDDVPNAIKKSADNSRDGSEENETISQNEDADTVWTDDWSNSTVERDKETSKEKTAQGDGWDNGDWGSMDDVNNDVNNDNSFAPADPDLPSSSSYGWDNNDENFLPMDSELTTHNSTDFFSNVVKESQKRKPSFERRVSPEKEGAPLQSKFAVQTINDQEDWSSDSWGSFEQPVSNKRERPPPKSRPMKLGAKKLGQD